MFNDNLSLANNGKFHVMNVPGQNPSNSDMLILSLPVGVDKIFVNLQNSTDQLPDTINFMVAPVPEPSSIALAFIGAIAGLIAYRRQFRKPAKSSLILRNSMKILDKIALTITVAAGFTAGAQAQINYTGGTYTQDFDIMGATGTTTPTDWFVSSGTGPAVTGTTVIAETGSSKTPGNYNFGVSGVHGIDERALGSLTAQGVQLDTEVAIKNGTLAPITQFTLNYDGEQWKPSFFADTLTLQLSTNGITWTPLGSAFNFISPIINSGTGALDGNAAANRVAGIGGTFTLGTPILPGGALFFRFADPDNGKTDAGFSVDNVSFQAVPEPSAYMLLGLGLLLCGQRFLRHRTA